MTTLLPNEVLQTVISFADDANDISSLTATCRRLNTFRSLESVRWKYNRLRYFYNTCVTIAGPSKSGKTTLCCAIANTMRESFDNILIFVDYDNRYVHHHEKIQHKNIFWFSGWRDGAKIRDTISKHLAGSKTLVIFDMGEYTDFLLDIAPLLSKATWIFELRRDQMMLDIVRGTAIYLGVGMTDEAKYRAALMSKGSDRMRIMTSDLEAKHLTFLT